MSKSLDITFGYASSPFGKCFIAKSIRGVCHLEFVDDNKDEIFGRFQDQWSKANIVQNDNIAQHNINKIFQPDSDKINLLLKGTNFQINVWKALINIPNGKLTSYQDIANFIGKPKSSRAVANAIGSNHIAYLIPCHRVIAKSGAISGYKWGSNRKKIIIATEGCK